MSEGSGFGVQGSGESGGRQPTEAGLVVRVPRGIRSKEKLLAILADKLRFPHYFGHNWDALEECLRDLSWLPAGQPVEIVHDDLPFGAGGENRGTYLDIVTKAAAAQPGRLRVILPEQAKTREP